MPRTRHRLDLLPLLDVFMVVLFVFATITEERMEDVAAARARIAAHNIELQGQLQFAYQQRDQARASVRDDAATVRRLERLQARADRAERELEELRQQTLALEEASNVADDAIRRNDAFTKLLDHFTVFEIEIVGLENERHEVVNRCCFRIDVAGEWIGCGEVPPAASDQTAWMDAGADGLVASLRKIKGGNAITIVRQDYVATYAVDEKLATAVRERLAHRQVYAGGVIPDTGCNNRPR